MSLIEVLLVLVVLGILANLALPLFTRTEATTLIAAARMLEADLAYAQIESVAHGDDPRVVAFDTAAGEYHIAPASAPGSPIVHAAGGEPYLVRFGAGRASHLRGVAIASLDMDDPDGILRFGPFGQLEESAPVTITLATEHHALSITVVPTTGETTIGELQ